MDTRVKERLVGAAVLVGIIVALVPEMLSGPKQERTAPAQNGQSDQVRTFTIDLTQVAKPTARELLPDDAPVAASSAEESDVPEEVPEEPVDASSSKESSQPAPREAPAPPATVAPANAARTETPPATQSSPTPTQTAAATPQPAKPREAAPVETGWAVQLGSFRNQDNAERLARTLRQGGYRAFVSRYGSGDSLRHRVRVGPEQDRAKAEALAQRLRRDGHQVSIVEHP